jgi:signal transduction histidine kinase
LAHRSPVPVSLDVVLDRRPPEAVELAAYFVVAEAVTNAAKHAHASGVDVHVSATDSALLVAVRDDGLGGADLTRGTGLVGLVDRVEVLGGTITLESPPGVGTSLEVALPLVPRPAGPPDLA